MKYSRQRDLIHQTVMQNPIHPTADRVYALVREQEPNISLGTVYRNLNLLVEQGLLLKIHTPNASDHFDGRCDPHYHILCKECGSVFDIEIAPLTQLESQLAQITDFTVTDYEILIHGICGQCRCKH